MRVKLGVLFVVALALLVGWQAYSAVAAPMGQAGDPARGKYLVNVAGCWGCHGQNLAGYREGGAQEQPESAPYGQAFGGPFGLVTAKNLTPDGETGIGKWSDADIEKALREGKTPEGEQLYPIMPYANYAGLSDQDMRDLIAYLRSVPAVKNTVPENKLNGPVPPAPPARPYPQTAPPAGTARGEYLVLNVAGCGDCHTTTGANGAPDRAKFLAGNAVPTAKGYQLAWNLTPDQKTGLGSWTAQQIATALHSGQRPNRGPVGGLMAEVVGVGHPEFQGFGFSQMTDADTLAIAQYLKTIPPVENMPAPPPGGKLAPLGQTAAAPAAQATAAPSAQATVSRPALAATAVAAGAQAAAQPAATATVPSATPATNSAGAATPATQPTTTAAVAAPPAATPVTPQTMPVTGDLPTAMTELILGLGAALGVLGVAWHRFRMR
ncbi:MAG: cytochrome c [Anaerolineae bacterium]